MLRDRISKPTSVVITYPSRKRQIIVLLYGGSVSKFIKGKILQNPKEYTRRPRDICHLDEGSVNIGRQRHLLKGKCVKPTKCNVPASQHHLVKGAKQAVHACYFLLYIYPSIFHRYITFCFLDY